MSAQGPTCALARFSFVTSTRAKARHNFNRSGPFLRRDLVPFYSAIDTTFVKFFETEADIQFLIREPFASESALQTLVIGAAKVGETPSLTLSAEHVF